MTPDQAQAIILCLDSIYKALLLLGVVVSLNLLKSSGVNHKWELTHIENRLLQIVDELRKLRRP